MLPLSGWLCHSSKLTEGNNLEDRAEAIIRVKLGIQPLSIKRTPQAFSREDRLKDLFAQFLEDLSGTMGTFPGTLLKSCVAKLSSTFSSSMQDVIRSDIIPTLFNKIMLHVSEFCPPPPPKVDDVNIPLNNKLDGLQDVIIGMNSVQSDKIESLSRDFAHMESQLRDQILDWKQQLAVSQQREADLAEQIKRRLGDIASVSTSLHTRIGQLTEPQLEKPKCSDEHLEAKFNNPFLHTASAQLNQGNKPTTSPRACAEEPSSNTPQWQLEFPFINHGHVDVEMRKEL
ncbi:hypothetical protein PCASD_09057 [Puccinia coronata f. sp. avenae]|uniref:Uncharacterized protein n=1 Tax=Puccinia coronata f. sp. avenae TaxID=200324 RepID=A0A2N5UIL7_9BASI|nr:hypothetical protein PCASD_09057 [Puccinia coronata f. sp. avenae]